MRKERLAQFRKKLEEKHRQLVEEVGRNVLYGKGPEDDSIKDLGDQASSAYNREFLFELGNGDLVHGQRKFFGDHLAQRHRCRRRRVHPD